MFPCLAGRLALTSGPPSRLIVVCLAPTLRRIVCYRVCILVLVMRAIYLHLVKRFNVDGSIGEMLFAKCCGSIWELCCIILHN